MPRIFHDVEQDFAKLVGTSDRHRARAAVIQFPLDIGFAESLECNHVARDGDDVRCFARWLRLGAGSEFGEGAGDLIQPIDLGENP